MLIIGAGGFAKEVLEIVNQNKLLQNLVFYDDVNIDIEDQLFNKYQIVKNQQQATAYFRDTDSHFALGIGNPILRYNMYKKFQSIGGVLTTTISPQAFISEHDVVIGDGSNILPGAIFSNGSKIGKGCIVYYNSVITHDCIVGDFVEISPSVNILGNCKIGSFSQIGASSTILPNVQIGENVIVGAGAVVTKDIPNNFLAVGIPAKVIKSLKPIDVY